MLLFFFFHSFFHSRSNIKSSKLFFFLFPSFLENTFLLSVLCWTFPFSSSLLFFSSFLSLFCSTTSLYPSFLLFFYEITSQPWVGLDYFCVFGRPFRHCCCVLLATVAAAEKEGDLSRRKLQQQQQQHKQGLAVCLPACLLGFFLGSFFPVSWLDHFYWCLFMWRARWSDLEKLRSHWPHLKGLTPVCFRKWRVSSSDRAKRHSQPSQEQR